MHDREVVIGGEKNHLVGVLAIVIVIAVRNDNVVIAIGTLMLVKQSRRMAHLVQNRVHRKSVSFPCRTSNVLTGRGEPLSPNLGMARWVTSGESNPPKSWDVRSPLQPTPAVPLV